MSKSERKDWAAWIREREIAPPKAQGTWADGSKKQGSLFGQTSMVPPVKQAPVCVGALIVYHGKCPDGAAAAWFVKCALERKNAATTIEMVPAMPGEVPEYAVQMVGMQTDVYIVDTCPDAKTLGRIILKAKSVVVHDHHATSEAAAAAHGFTIQQHECGASLAYAAMGGAAGTGLQADKLVAYLRDFDLYTNALPETMQVRAVIKEHLRVPSDTAHVARWFAQSFDLVCELGAHIANERNQQVLLLAAGARKCTIDGKTAWAVRTPGAELASEVANMLAERSGAIGIAYRGTEHAASMSLRSVQGKGEDVGAIAQKFGGGGHKHAAGMGGRSPLKFVTFTPDEHPMAEADGFKA